ncbi:MAG: GTP-binding protein [Lachnospiraceae bacterium]|nr:GTP-binding protein [Candidatus Darwinimomas equi]
MIKTKVDVISGFLGAGKTTFIKRLLADVIKNEKVVLIENEFGEIAVDGGFLKDAGIEIKEMSQGCICCSLVGDFEKSLKEILENYAPDRIIIEPSGVGKLSDVLKAVRDVEDELNVESNSAVTVVDARKCGLYHNNFGEFFNNQIQFASTVMLSRTDVAEQSAIDDAVSVVKEINPSATVITTPLALLSPAKLMEILESPVDLKAEMLSEIEEEHEHHHHDEEEHEHHQHHDEEEHEHHHHHDEEEHEHHHHHHHGEGECDDPECECHHHGHHHADEIFESWGRENVSAMNETGLLSILHTLADTEAFGNIVRAKGMIPNEESKTEWLYFDVVPGEVEIRKGEPDLTGKVCVIGPELNEEQLEEAFR